MHGCNIGAPGVQVIASALGASAFVTAINLGGNALGNTGAATLAAALTSNGVLLSLDLCNNSIECAGVQSLAVVLAAPECRLQELLLAVNLIGDDGAEVLAACLTARAEEAYAATCAPSALLGALHLNTNRVGAAGAGALLEAMRAVPSLHEVRLTNNQPEVDVGLLKLLDDQVTTMPRCHFTAP